MFKTIVVPTDLSECSARALSAALDLTRTWGSQLVLMHINDELRQGMADAAEVDNNMFISAVGEVHMKRLLETANCDADGAEKVPKDRISIYLASGSPVSRIVDHANEVNADLIVMGTHGRSGLVDKVFGSTTERVMRKANCSVFTVKPEGYPFLRS